jgi:5-methylcytosine-specific restriction endonuclease McrA
MNTRELIRAYEEEGLPLVCHWCGREFDDAHPPTKDHITPKAEKGGKNRGNLVLACEPCNSARARPTSMK